MITKSQYLDSAKSLHRYLVRAHWNGASLTGPDPGIRFNTRIWRFLKSYTRFLPWSDNLTYMQAQGYWVFCNWQLFDLTGDQQAKSIALACTENIMAMQESGGYWLYPNPEWRNRIATVEGCYAGLGLLESYARVKDSRFLEAAGKWHDYLFSGVGFRRQRDEDMLAVNYFAHQTGDGGGVPNNSTLVLWLFARFYQLTGKAKYLDPCEKLVKWLRHVQLPSGELPYALGGDGGNDRIHFICFQYAAFQFIDLVAYNEIVEDPLMQPILIDLARYLSDGLTEQGMARYDCSHASPEVLYYTSAIGRALSLATDRGYGDYRDKAERAFQRVLSHQRADGKFDFHSRKNYRCLTDRRSYPRYLSMILHHLLDQSQHSESSNDKVVDLQLQTNHS